MERRIKQINKQKFIKYNKKVHKIFDFIFKNIIMSKLNKNLIKKLMLEKEINSF
jgi:hypothetical protein